MFKAPWSGDFKESLTLALDVVVRNPLRSFLTVLGIMIGVTTIIVIGAVINGLNSNVLDSVESLGSSTIICYRFSFATLGRQSPAMLQRKELKAEWADGLARLPHVVAAAPLADVQDLDVGVGSSAVRRGNNRASNVILQGDTPSIVEISDFDLQRGRSSTIRTSSITPPSSSSATTRPKRSSRRVKTQLTRRFWLRGRYSRSSVSWLCKSRLSAPGQIPTTTSRSFRSALSGSSIPSSRI